MEEVLKLYDKLPHQCKLKSGEFTVLAAFRFECIDQPDLSHIVNLATGTKCLGENQSIGDDEGCLLSDSHAEVIAKRALQRYLYQCYHITQLDSDFIQNNNTFPFERHEDKLRLKENWLLHLYISDSPCGDASIYTCDNHPTSSQSELKQQYTGKCIFAQQHKHVSTCMINPYS